MAISTEGKIGIGLGLLGLLGAGVLVVAPEHWVKVAGWTMIAIAMAGFLLLGGHQLFEWILRLIERRIENKKKVDAAPSKEELYELHEQIEVVKTKLYADEQASEGDSDKITYPTFHEAAALVTQLKKLGLEVPFQPEYEKALTYEKFNGHMYKYFCAVSPYLRIGDLKAAKYNAASALRIITGSGPKGPPAVPPQAPTPQDTPERTSPQTSL